MSTVKAKAPAAKRPASAARTGKAAAPVNPVEAPAAEVPDAEVPDATAPKAVAPEAVAAAPAQDGAGAGYDQALRFGRENFDALIEAGSILSKGFQDIHQAVMGIAQENLEQSVSTAKALFYVKTLRELADLQNSSAKASFDKFLIEGTRLSDLSVRTVERALGPINQRVNAAVNKLVKPAA